MILANTRYHLTRGDAELVARLIARDSGEELVQVEKQLCDHGIDAVLDDPRLPSAMLRSGQGWSNHLGRIQVDEQLAEQVVLRERFCRVARL